MSDGWTGRYLKWSSLLALISGLALLPLAPNYGRSAMLWSGFGWLLMVLIGVAGGAWICAVLGRPGVRFLVALVACMLARLIVSMGGVYLVVTRERDALVFFLLGLAAGFLPLQVFESAWVSKRAKAMRRAAETAEAAFVPR